MPIDFLNGNISRMIEIKYHIIVKDKVKVFFVFFSSKQQPRHRLEATIIQYQLSNDVVG